MTFQYSEALLEFMKQKNQNKIVIEVITSDSSDFELTELHVHLVSERMARIFVEDRGYKPVETEHGTVLLPKYVLEYDDTITFDLKKKWIFKSVSYTGIRL